MEKIKISIIVPVYNVENYIAECVDSILQQNLKNAEIILVDDGSTDGSGKICDTYASNYSFIKVIHQENKGLSGARNAGITNATGEYLMFLDSDDYINKNVNLQRIINYLHGDVIQYKFVYYYEQSNKYIYLNDYIIEENENSDINAILYNHLKRGYLSSTATDKFIRREVVLQNHILFQEGIVSEDLEWVLRLFQKIKTFQLMNENIYVYRQQRKGAITSYVKKQNIDCIFQIIKYWYHYDYENEICKKTYLGFLAYHYIIILSQLNRLNCTKEKRNEIYQYKDIMQYSDNRKVKMCNQLIKMMGLPISLFIFRTYIKLKNKGITKL